MIVLVAVLFVVLGRVAVVVIIVISQPIVPTLEILVLSHDDEQNISTKKVVRLFRG